MERYGKVKQIDIQGWLEEDSVFSVSIREICRVNKNSQRPKWIIQMWEASKTPPKPGILDPLCFRDTAGTVRLWEVLLAYLESMA